MIYAAGTELALCKYGLEEEEGKEKNRLESEEEKTWLEKSSGGGKIFSLHMWKLCCSLSLSPAVSLTPFLSLSLNLSLSLSLALSRTHTPCKCARPVILSHTYSFLPRLSSVQTMTYSVTSISTVLKTPHENGN